MYALAACGALDLSVLAHSGCKVVDTRIHTMSEGFVGDFTQTRSVIEDLHCGKPTCGFSRGLFAHVRQQCSTLERSIRHRPRAATRRP